MSPKQLCIELQYDMVPFVGSSFDVHRIILQKAMACIDGAELGIVIDPTEQMIPLSLGDIDLRLFIHLQISRTERRND